LRRLPLELLLAGSCDAVQTGETALLNVAVSRCQINAMGQASFLEITGQSKRFLTGCGLFVILGASLLFIFLYADLTDYFAFMFVSMVVAAFISGIWLCLAIRCPRCQARIVWIAVREQGVGGWLLWLLALTKCPRCSFPQ
jgi:hypothetical protein